MALLFMDGFDHVDDGYERMKWDTVPSTGGMTYADGYGRGGGWGIRLHYSTSIMGKSVPNSPTLIMGVAINFEDPDYSTAHIQFRESGSIQVGIRLLLDGTVLILRGTTEIGRSSAGACPSYTWNYLEVKAVCSNTVGSVEVRVNGNTAVLVTDVDTCITANEYFNSLVLTNPSNNSPYTYIDDLYICDTTGTENNDFLGDVTVRTIYPIADGTNADFTPSTGADNYATVDEPQLVDETDYNSATAIGAKDTFTMTQLTGNPTVLAVQTTAAVNNTTTGTVNVRGISRSGDTPADNEGSDFALSQTVKAAMHIFEKEPTDDVAWTVAKINSAEFGIKVES